MKCDNCRYKKMCVRRFHPMGDTFNCEHYEEYEQRPHGEWLTEPHSRIIRCSNCGAEENMNKLHIAKWCYSCGANMKDGAKWITTSNIWADDDLAVWGHYNECSCCHNQEKWRTPFCPNCGAKMQAN